MAEILVEEPLFFTDKPTYEKELWDDIPLKRKSVEKQNTQDLLSPSSQNKKSGELFPKIQRMLPLPEKGTKISFDKPAFSAPREKKESKPLLPQPEWVDPKTTVATKSTQTETPKTSWLTGWIPWNREKGSTEVAEHRKTEEVLSPNPWVRVKTPKTTPSETESLIDYHHRVNTRGSSQKEKDDLAHLPNHGGAILAKLIGMITDYQTMSQSDQLKVFGATSDTLEEIRKKQFELVMEQIRNRKKNETWSYRAEMLEYFGIATGIVGGSTMIASSVATGGSSVIPGMQMLAGSIITLTAKIAGKSFSDKTVTPIIGIGGALLSGWGMAKGMAALGSVPKTLTTAGNLTTKATELIVGQKSTKTKANQFGLNAANAKLQFKREDSETTMRNLVGGFKASKASSDLLGVATKALRTEDEIKSRIALGSRA